MSFRVRDFVALQVRTARFRVIDPYESDSLVEGIGLVLAEESRRLRAKGHKRLFKKVDALLAGPRTRQILEGPDRLLLNPEQIGECVRCGENFVKTQRSRRFCTKKCWYEHKVWIHARGRRAV